MEGNAGEWAFLRRFLTFAVFAIVCLKYTHSFFGSVELKGRKQGAFAFFSFCLLPRRVVWLWVVSERECFELYSKAQIA